ncbi:MAG TPA: hypothetical protein VMG10_08895 [Gemmataceae bacterium]|nr:hypothetical protein [Gemmataceae bacterium]
MGTASRAAALAIVAGLLSGCGTVANLETGARQGWKNAQIYGGVRRDVQSGADWFDHSWTPLKNWEIMQDVGAVVGVALVGIDVPLSAVGDTLTLPVTIPASIWGGSRKAAAVSGQASPQQPAVISQQPVTIAASESLPQRIAEQSPGPAMTKPPAP